LSLRRGEGRFVTVVYAVVGFQMVEEEYFVLEEFIE